MAMITPGHPTLIVVRILKEILKELKALRKDLK